MDGNKEMSDGVMAHFELLTDKGRQIFVDELIERYASLICERIKKAAKCWCAKLTGERRKKK